MFIYSFVSVLSYIMQDTAKEQFMPIQAQILNLPLMQLFHFTMGY